MSTKAVPEGLLGRDVIRVSSQRRGLGRKVVVVRCHHETESVGVDFLTLIGGGSQLGETPGWTSMRRGTPVQKMGIWRGPVEAGARGYWEEINSDGEVVAERGAKVATTKTKGKKGSKSGAKSSAKSNGGEKRASNEELDKLAAKVVTMRDDKEMSWADIEEALDIGPGRLRSLYNRGEGEASGSRKGTAKKAETKGKGKGKSSRRSRRGADPSDED